MVSGFHSPGFCCQYLASSLVGLPVKVLWVHRNKLITWESEFKWSDSRMQEVVGGHSLQLWHPGEALGSLSSLEFLFFWTSPYVSKSLGSLSFVIKELGFYPPSHSGVGGGGLSVLSHWNKYCHMRTEQHLGSQMGITPARSQQVTDMLEVL